MKRDITNKMISRDLETPHGRARTTIVLADHMSPVVEEEPTDESERIDVKKPERASLATVEAIQVAGAPLSETIREEREDRF